MGEDSSFASCIISQLKERNMKEHSFSEVIFHSNRLLESLDYLHKDSINRKLTNIKPEEIPESSHDSPVPKPEEFTMLVKCCSLQKELAESHKKVSEYALQIIDFKNQLDEKDKSIAFHKNELQQAQISIRKYKDLYESHCHELEKLKTNLQNKTDECDTLNITYSSLENKKNDLEIENKILRSEVLIYKTKELASLSNESLRMVVPRESKATEIKANIRKPRSESPKQLESIPSKKTDKTSVQSSDTVIPSAVKHEFFAHDSEVCCVSWVPSSPQLITAGADRKIKLWDMSDSCMALKKIVRDCNSAIMSVDLDIEDGLLLCASCDFTSRVWTVNDFTIRCTLMGHSGKVMSAKFLPIENQIISGSTDQTLKLWDVRRQTCIQTISTGSNVYDVISKSGHTVGSCHANGYVNFWDVRSSALTAQVHCSAGVTSLDISRSGFLLLASQRDNKLAIIDVRKYKEICSLFGSGFEVAFDWTRAKFSPDNQYCCCGSKNGCIFIWNVHSGTVTKELKAHTAPVISCSWSSCGSYLATCDSQKKCTIWSNK